MESGAPRELELIFSDFDPQVCEAAQSAFGAVLAESGALVRVRVVQGNIVAVVKPNDNRQHNHAEPRHRSRERLMGTEETTNHVIDTYEDYLLGMGAGIRQTEASLRLGPGGRGGPVIFWDSAWPQPASSARSFSSTFSAALEPTHQSFGTPYHPEINEAPTFLM
jgi:hypothetical protein